jgi:hypothetical protein
MACCTIHIAKFQICLVENNDRQMFLHILDNKSTLKHKPRWRSGSASHLYKPARYIPEINEKVTRSIRVRGIFLNLISFNLLFDKCFFN